MAVTETTLQQIADAFLHAFDDMVAEDHTKLRTPDCQHLFAPSSLKFPSPKTNQEFADHVTMLKKVLISFPVTPKETIINEAKRQITIWATGVPHFRDEVKKGTPDSEWEYQGEYVFMLNVNEEGKIERIVEFLDSLGTKNALGMMAKAQEAVSK